MKFCNKCGKELKSVIQNDSWIKVQVCPNTECRTEYYTRLAHTGSDEFVYGKKLTKQEHELVIGRLK